MWWEWEERERDKWQFLLQLEVVFDSGGIGSYWRSLRELHYQQDLKKKKKNVSGGF